METADIGAALVLLFILSCFAYGVAPPHWQSLSGFLIIMLCWIPAGLLLLAVLTQPAILVPAVFVAGLVAIGRNPSRG